MNIRRGRSSPAGPDRRRRAGPGRRAARALRHRGFGAGGSDADRRRAHPDRLQGQARARPQDAVLPARRQLHRCLAARRVGGRLRRNRRHVGLRQPGHDRLDRRRAPRGLGHVDVQGRGRAVPDAVPQARRRTSEPEAHRRRHRAGGRTGLSDGAAVAGGLAVRGRQGPARRPDAQAEAAHGATPRSGQGKARHR